MKSKKIVFLFLSMIVLFSLSTLFALAAEFRFAPEGQNVNVNKNETVKNLYTAGNVISIDGEIQSDLYTAGNVITVESNVENNFSGVGGTIIIKGDVGNNVHIAGGTVIVQGEIMEDLFVVGGNVLIGKSAKVEGDLVVAGGMVDIEGPIKGSVFIGGGDVNINNKIGGQVKITADILKIGEFAEIEKNIKYTSSKKAEIHRDAKISGTINFNQKAIKTIDKSSVVSGFFAILATFLLLKIATGIVVGLALVYFFKNIIKSIVKKGLNNVGANVGMGIAVLFLTPVVGVILIISIVGVYLAGLISILYVLLIMLSSAIANIVFGSLLLKVLKKKEEYSVGWQEVIFGVIVLKIVWFIPFVGWLLYAVFMLISMGAISSLIYKSFVKK